MMKKLAVIFTLMILVIGGYVGLWYSNARILKNEILESSQLLSFFGAEPFTDLSRLEVSGLPSTLAVRMNQPKFNALKMFQFEMSYIQVGRGIFNNNIILSIGSPSNFTIPPFGDLSDGLTIVYNAVGNDDCWTLSMHGTNWKDFITSQMSLNPIKGKVMGMELLDQVKSLTIHSSGREIKNEKTGEIYYKSGPLDFSLAISPQTDAHRSIDLKYSIQDQQYMPALDKLVQDIASMPLVRQLLQSPDMQKPYLTSLNLSAAGKSSMTADFHYQGVATLAFAEPQDFVFEIRKLTAQDELQSYDMSGAIKGVALPNMAGVRDIEVNIDGRYQATEKMNTYIKERLPEQLKQSFALQFGQMDGADQQEVGAAKFNEALNMFIDGLFTNIMPNYHTLGEIHTGIHLTYDQQNQNISIKDISVKTEKGGFGLEGGVTGFNPTQPPKEVNVQLKLYDYENILNGFVTGAQEFGAMYERLQQKPSDQPFNSEEHKQVIDQVKQAIISAGKKEGNDLVLTLTMKDNEVMIGNVPALAFIAMLSAIFTRV